MNRKVSEMHCKRCGANERSVSNAKSNEIRLRLL